MSDESNQVYAALDIGSNSFHLMVAKCSVDGIIVLDRHKESVRLAEGLSESGVISPAATARALACLGRVAERIRSISPQNFRAVATHSLRVAHNSDAFLEKAQAALGAPIDVISGTEESRLIYLGIGRDICPHGQKRLTIDIGGGSTELALGMDEPERVDSLFLGCVSTSREYFPDGKLSEKNYRNALLAVRAELQPQINTYAAPQWAEVIGSSGTIKSISSVLEAYGQSRTGTVSLNGLKWLSEELCKQKSLELLNFEGLDEQRLAVFPGGVAVLHGLALELGIQEMQVSDYALREGVIWELSGISQVIDQRATTIQNFSSRYQIDQVQARRVDQLSRQLFLQLYPLEPHSKRLQLLTWASLLHEIGLSVSHSHFHKHSAYLLEHSDMPGFSKQQQKMLGFLALNQRRKLKDPTELYGFSPDWILVILLRLSTLLQRRRETNQLSDVLKITVNNDKVALAFSKNWLKEHPLSEHDLEEEQRFLKRVGFKLSWK